MSNTILIEGAVPSELDVLIERFRPAREIDLGGWTLMTGMAGGEDVALLNTHVGVANAAASTALACAMLHPRAVISQGTAGAHDLSLHTGDLVIGARIVRLSAFMGPAREHGIDPTAWKPLALHGDAGEMPVMCSDAGMVELAQRIAARHGYGRPGAARVVTGTIGSGDTWNREYELIAHLNATYGTDCEEMETFAAAQVCARMGVPFLSVRVISNNERLGERYAPQTAAAMQRVTGDVAAELAEKTAD